MLLHDFEMSNSLCHATSCSSTFHTRKFLQESGAYGDEEKIAQDFIHMNDKTE